MAGTCAPTGASSRVAIKQGSGAITWSTGATQLRHNGESLGVQYPTNWIIPPSLTGNRWLEYTDLRRGPSLVRGQLRLSLRASEFQVYAPLIFGGAAVVSGGGYTFALSSDVPYFGVLVDRVTDVFEYLDCKVDRAVISSQSSALQGESPSPVDVLLDIVGITGSAGNSWDGGITLAAMSSPYKPYIHEETILTIDGSAYRKTNLVIAVNNNLAPKFYDGLTADSICPNGKRTIQFRSTHPFASPEDALYGIAEAGVGGSLEFNQTDTTVSTLFTFKRMMQTPEDPQARGPGAINLFGDYLIAGDDDETEMTVFNDVTA